ncbi:sodium:proton antiporter [Lichenibacterium minor]|uniref:Sodium:proton antiporter n=1 Tax=Lichenibacterium minor TaxID=2316528 RepID=A0A4Q2UE23_9HYPH|nr:sodium:proton antiporter [Lichenibacterium minor]RYC33356.1 sodium:proton antiporter [Lichenibacterium minor]
MIPSPAAGAPSLLYGLPFAGLLLSIALMPLLAPHWWEKRFPLVTLAWASLFALPYAALHGVEEAGTALLGTVVHEYLPFILLLLALFVVAGGIRVAGNLVGTPNTNLALLGLGTLLASLLGTTGAAMLLIRPLIRANGDRRHRTHVFVFFIFLVGNIGGSLTPLGDPPLFLGFLRGVDFGWTLRAMAAPMLLSSGLLLLVFTAIDRWHWRREPVTVPSHLPRRVRIEGGYNAAFLLVVVGAVLLSGLWRPGRSVPLGLGVSVSWQGLARDTLLLAAAVLSYAVTPARVRIENAYTWVPIREVAILFAGIFVTIVPVLDALKAGPAGPFGPLLHLVDRPDGTPVVASYFWLSGALSSVLDNAPTYLVFFDMAGGDPARLMGDGAATLLAISCGAVFMGANTYLGNAPNFMVKAICEEGGIRMPGFFGYMAWSGLALLPLFGLLTLVFF